MALALAVRPKRQILCPASKSMHLCPRAKAKARTSEAKARTSEAKAKAKDLTFEAKAKAKAKDLISEVRAKNIHLRLTCHFHQIHAYNYIHNVYAEHRTAC
jgi:hypothetical protein